MKMKIILLAVAFVCLSMPAQAQKEKQTVKSTDDTQKNRVTVEEALTAIERSTWKNIIDKKYDDFARLLADDYQSVYGKTRNTKASEVGGLKLVTFKSAELSDLKVQMISDEAAVVTALVKSDAVTAEGVASPANLRTTSVYAKRGGVWLIVFHTDELIRLPEM